MSSKTVPEPAARPAWSLAARLAVWYAGSAFLLVLLATGYWYWVLVANLDREDDELLADKVRVVRKLLRDIRRKAPTRSSRRCNGNRRFASMCISTFASSMRTAERSWRHPA
jgi:hypothetical protein